MHIASLVMGIVSLILSWLPIWGFVLAIVALVIAIIAMVVKKTEDKGKGMKIAGIILSIIATVISLIITVSSVLVMKAAFEIVDTGKELVDEALEESSTMSNTLQSQILQSYDNKVLSGAQARTVISQYMMSEDITVILMDAAKTEMIATVGAKNISDGAIVSKGEYYEITSDEYSAEGGTMHKTSVSEFMMQGGETYINPMNNYNSYLLKISGTDNVVGIVLAEQ